MKEMYDRDLSIEAFKARSTSLGHENAMTILANYRELSLFDMLGLIRPKSVW